MGGDRHPDRWTSSYPKLAEGPVGKQIHSIYEARLRQFTGNGQYAGDNLNSKLYEARSSGEPAVKLSVYSPPDLTRPTFTEATSHDFEPTKVGKAFGPSWATHWFKIRLTVPKELTEKERLEFHWNAHNEGLIWTEDGNPLQGLTGDGEREQWILPDSFRDGREHTFFIEMACNGMFGNPDNDIIQPPNPQRYFTLDKADIVAVNLDARALWMDFWIIGDAAREFEQNSWQEHKALQVANRIMDHFIAGNGSSETIRGCREIAQEYLGKHVDSDKVYKDGSDMLVNAIGYCHIDTCWLWPFAETKRKVARSWANQIDLMDRYPEHRFICSQAQQFQWLKMYYPPLWERVKQKVEEGQFQPIGGSWVEHDTNLPGGESLIRQFLYGQRFFELHFGKRSKTFLLPDTFGYCAQIPQICRISGMTRFFTQKLSWNNINSFPHTTFNWVAPDGSQVLTHMAPAETYTAEAHFGDVKRSVTQHKSMDQDPSSLLVFGKGDGGGGPTWEHLEKLRRCRGLTDTVGKLPRVHMGDSMDDFYSKLEKKVEQGTKFVTWYGELYFELHRGTYTTQAKNKRNNRRAEVMLHDIEYLATLASIKELLEKGSSIENHSYRYPKREIDEMWESVLLCQFHDCLPGSSIEMCYDDSDEIYAKVFKTGHKLLEDAMSQMNLLPNKQEHAQNKGWPVNTLPWQGMVDILITMYNQNSVPRTPPPFLSAFIEQTHANIFKLWNRDITITVDTGLITSIYDRQSSRELIPRGSKANQLVLFDDKPLYWQAWDVEVYHLASRKELKPHKVYISETSNASLVSLVIETRISDVSHMTTTLSLSVTDNITSPPSTYRTATPIEFSSHIVWKENKKFLKVEFPVDINPPTQTAAYETQFGIVHRPTHYNTSWDMAKFEVCCHRFADVSEANYGVSILNDSKYGFATEGKVMRLSLLRAPKAPDAHADMGEHFVRYAMLPHDGPLDARTVRAAREFNHPLVAPKYTISTTGAAFDGTPASTIPQNRTPGIFHPSEPDFSFIRRLPSDLNLATRTLQLLYSLQLKEGSSPGLVLDTVKRGEDDEDIVHPADRRPTPPRGRSIIVRLYDALGGKASGTLLFGSVPVRHVVKCNALEDDGEMLDIVTDTWPRWTSEEGRLRQDVVETKAVRVELRAFEVQTLRLCL